MQAVCVLILVDQYIAELAAVIVAYLILLLQQRDRVKDDIVEIERIRLGKPAHVARVDLGDGLSAPIAAAGPSPGIILRRFHRVLGVRDGREHLARRELLFVDAELLQNILDDALGVVRIINGKVARKAEAVDIAAQDAHAGGVERHRPYALRPLDAEGGQAFAQLVCRLVRKRHRQHRPRRGGVKTAETHHAAALLRRRLLGVAFEKRKVILRRPGRHLRAVASPPVGQKVCDTVDEHRRLAAARACEQQQRALGRQHAAALLGVHFCKIPRDGRSASGGIAGIKITHMLCFPFLNFPHLTLFFLSGQLPSAKIDFLFDFFS